MAFYKNPNMLTQTNIDAFDGIYGPGHMVIHSGIYRCTGCGKEIAANGLDPFPPQNHHQHGALSGPIRWQLVVMASH